MMQWLVLGGLLLLAAFAFYLLYRWPKIVLSLSIAIAIASCAGWRAWVKHVEIDAMPEAFEIADILYEKSDGGMAVLEGEETHFILYRLPDSVAGNIAAGGVEYLAHLPRDAKQRFPPESPSSKWHATPMTHDDTRASDYFAQHYRRGPYVCPNDFCLGVPLDLFREYETGLDTLGSYYAYGPHGLTLVSPPQRRVYLLHSD